MKEESEKAGLKFNIQKKKIMASGPITSWQIDRETRKPRQTLFSWAPKSPQMLSATMKFKRCLLLGRKAMTNLDSILKSRDIALLTKVHIVKAMVFSVEGLILKLKFQYFGHLMQRVNSRERP